MSNLADRRQISMLVDLHGAVFLLRDADAAGISRGVLRRMFATGDLLRLAKSAFALTATMADASPWERFRLRSIAFAACAQEGTFLTGAAAAAVLGLPMIADPPALPIAIRHGSPHAGHRLTPYGSVRHGPLPLRHRTTKSNVPVVSPAYCAIDVARHFGPRDGLVVADKVLHMGTPREVLADLTRRMDRYPGISEARWVVEHADQRAESPLETLGRFAFLSASLPAPKSNVWIPVGGQWFRVDHLIPETGVILEADGAVKYDNRDDASVLIANDRDRERLLRGLDFGLARYQWAIAAHRPAEILYRAREAARLRGSKPIPTCWTLDSPFA
ncbi:hypothetical protein ABIB25_002293 [Nakamurella sp. UYEF19]|uniref:type IV toxin-antitoxin system AbiEi family antitoxin domain-containing protein n=1 Tax=Nakamurella sp. UYEF19 TaxID=1756392 RepID=UPI0033953909